MENIEDTKVCFRCKTEKHLSEFSKNSGNKCGLDSYCKQCKSQYQKARRLTYELDNKLPIGDSKTCLSCKADKALNEFYKMKTSKDGLDYKCKECVKAHNFKYYHEGGLKERRKTALKLEPKIPKVPKVKEAKPKAKLKVRVKVKSNPVRSLDTLKKVCKGCGRKKSAIEFYTSGTSKANLCEQCQALVIPKRSLSLDLLKRMNLNS